MNTLVLGTHFTGFPSVAFQLQPLALLRGEEISSGGVKEAASQDETLLAAGWLL